MRSSYGDERAKPVVPPRLSQLVDKKNPVIMQRETKSQHQSIQIQSKLMTISFALLTVASPAQVTPHISQNVSPCNSEVHSVVSCRQDSHPLLLSVLPYLHLLVLFKDIFYEVCSIIGQIMGLSISILMSSNQDLEIRVVFIFRLLTN